MFGEVGDEVGAGDVEEGGGVGGGCGGVGFGVGSGESPGGAEGLGDVKEFGSTVGEGGKTGGIGCAEEDVFGGGEVEEFWEDVFGEDVCVYGGDDLDEFHLVSRGRYQKNVLEQEW